MRAVRMSLACLVAALLFSCGTPSEAPLSLRLRGSSSVTPLARMIADAYVASHPSATFDLTESGTSDGVMAAGTSMTDLGMASRPLSSAELMMYDVVPVEIARDAIAIAVHPGRTMPSSITLDQLADVFAGRVTDWSELGGASAPIVAYAREAGSGTRDFFEGVVLGTDAFGPMVMDRTNNLGVRAAVAADPNGIGFFSFGAADGSVTILALDSGAGPVAPTLSSIRMQSYALTRPLLLVQPPSTTLSAEIFVDFCLTPAAQDIAAGMGFVPVI